MRGNRKPIAGYPSKREAVEALLEMKVSVSEIARLTETKRHRVIKLKSDKKCREQARTRLTVNRSTIAAMEIPARERGMTVTRLAEAVLAAVVADNLFDAVLGVPQSRQKKVVYVPSAADAAAR